MMLQLNKLQAAEWMGDLLMDENKSSCYIADAAESMQHEWLATILSKRGEDGRLALMAIDMAIMGSKTAEAQAAYATRSKLLMDVCPACNHGIHYFH